MPDARVYKIEPGTVLVFSGVDASPETWRGIVSEIAGKCGHSDFVIVPLPPDGDVTESTVDELVGLLAAQGIELEAKP